MPSRLLSCSTHHHRSGPSEYSSQQGQHAIPQSPHQRTTPCLDRTDSRRNQSYLYMPPASQPRLGFDIQPEHSRWRPLHSRHLGIHKAARWNRSSSRHSKTLQNLKLEQAQRSPHRPRNRSVHPRPTKKIVEPGDHRMSSIYLLRMICDAHPILKRWTTPRAARSEGAVSGCAGTISTPPRSRHRVADAHRRSGHTKCSGERNTILSSR